MPTAMVTFNGRITIPTQVRRQLGLNTGDSVDFVEIEKGRFAIVPRTEEVTDSRSWAPKMDHLPSAEEGNPTIQ